MAVAVMIFWPSRPAEQDGLPKVAYAEEKTLSFDGYTRIVTPVERFAPVTLEAWIEPASYDLTLPRYIIGSSIPNQHGIGLAQAGYHLAAGIIPGWFHSQAAIPRHRWSHVAGTFADGKSVLYLNGEEVARGPGTLDEGGTPFVIGNIGLKRTDALFFHGRMRSVRISKGVRFKESFIPDQQFRPDPPDSPTPAVLIYDGSKTEDGRIEDHSRIGNHGDVQTFSLAAE